MELKIPPPVVFLICAALIYFSPNFTEPMLILRILAVIIALTAISIDLLGLLAFWQKKTTINPLDPSKTSHLVTHGIYRFTRNPMYLGLACQLTAWTLWLGNLLALLWVWGFILYITRFQIVPEERLLAEKFGAEFKAYQQQVPRWLWR